MKVLEGPVAMPFRFDIPSRPRKARPVNAMNETFDAS